ncbi:MAG TPA: CHASE2 domain-containing protein, partial [Pyrinomonadaceae bacterium]|nr:CHASE2 domain-containing protein [Pyrinomonadaceae bacterium]
MKNKPFFQTIIFILIGLLTTLILLAAKVMFEQTSAGQRLESYGYETLHSYLPYFTPREDMPVVVVDVGNPDEGVDQVTPRDKLEEIINAIVKENPAAIAVAIDFSPQLSGPWQDPKDPDFFEYCLRLRENGIPIFLGVERSAQSMPESWLGVRKYQPLAVGVGFHSHYMDKVILWFGSDIPSERLPSLSLAMARSYRATLPQPPALFSGMLVAGENSDHQTIRQGDAVFTYSDAIVNYSTLDALKTGSLSATAAQTIADNGHIFPNKLVLIGKIRNTDDLHNIALQANPVAGVLLHASAT